MSRKLVNCYHCNNPVEKDNAVLEIHKPKDREYRRNLHKECHSDYLLTLEENEKWNNLYEYVRSEIFRYPKNKSLSRHCVNRLQGLRSGEYGARKNTKVFLSENGYTYDVILMTFKVKKLDIIYAVHDNYKLETEKSKIDYMMAMILNNINDVSIRLEEKKKSDDRIEKVEIDVNADRYEFVNKTDIKSNRVASKLDHLF